MGKHDSTKSADNKFKINPHDFFVPVIVMVVLCILIVATFHDNDPGDRLTGVADMEQAVAATDTTAVTAIHLKTPEVAVAPLRARQTTAISNQTIPHDQAIATQAVDDAETADADLMSLAQTSTTVSIDGAVANPARNAAPSGKQATDENAPDRDRPASSGSGKQTASAHRRQVTIPMNDQRRRHYQEAREIQKAHRMKMLEYRAEVMKRIEQDRRDLYRYRHNSAQQHHEHQDRDRDKPQQAHNGA